MSTTTPQLLHNYTTDGDFLRHLRDQTPVLEPLTSASADHIAAGGLSANPPETELLHRISDNKATGDRTGIF